MVIKKRMSHAMAKVNTSEESSNKAKEYSYASVWPKCSHAGCPLQTNIKSETVTCTYHYREYGRNAECITESVKKFEPLLKKYVQMVFWNPRQWNDKRDQLMGWPVFPATEVELDYPTIYLNRFKKWIDNNIKAKAEKFYRDGVYIE